jgi:hypothetical protein
MKLAKHRKGEARHPVNFLIPALDKLFPSDFLAEINNYSSLNKIYWLE